jgi:hypothetical protein
MQVIAVYLLVTGNRFVRVLVVAAVLLAIPSIYQQAREVSSLSMTWVGFSIAGYVIKAIAVALLFGSVAGSWFKKKPRALPIDTENESVASPPARKRDSWPPIVIVTLLLGVYSIYAACRALVPEVDSLLLAQKADAVQHAVQLIVYSAVWLIASAVALYTVFVRPRWGRYSSMCFALWLCVGGLLTAALQYVGAVLSMKDTYQLLGASIGFAVSSGLGVLYLMFMAFGRNARTCFARP